MYVLIVCTLNIAFRIQPEALSVDCFPRDQRPGKRLCFHTGAIAAGLCAMLNLPDWAKAAAFRAPHPPAIRVPVASITLISFQQFGFVANFDSIKVRKKRFLT